MHSPLLVVLRKHWSEAGSRHRDMLQVVEALVVVEGLLRKSRFAPRFPALDRQKVKRMVFRFCQRQHSLLRTFHTQPLFNATTKSHYLCEIALAAEYFNPQLGACCAGEDLTQLARHLIASSSCGSQPLTAQATAMKKYTLALNFELQNLVPPLKGF